MPVLAAKYQPPRPADMPPGPVLYPTLRTSKLACAPPVSGWVRSEDHLAPAGERRGRLSRMAKASTGAPFRVPIFLIVDVRSEASSTCSGVACHRSARETTSKSDVVKVFPEPDHGSGGPTTGT